MKILSLTISDWYWLSQIASVVLLGLTVVSGIGAIVTGKVLNARQSKEIEELKLKRVELERSLAPIFAGRRMCQSCA